MGNKDLKAALLAILSIVEPTFSLMSINDSGITHQGKVLTFVSLYLPHCNSSITNCSQSPGKVVETTEYQRRSRHSKKFIELFALLAVVH